MIATRTMASVAVWMGAVVAAAGAGWAAEPGSAVVYSDDFEKGVGKGWSMERADVTPKGERRFLGPFSTERVSLRLEKLPPGTVRLRVSFDLYVMGTWDGAAVAGRDGVTPVGPDVWRMSVARGKEGAGPAAGDEGRVIVETTFSNFDQPGDPVVKEAQTQGWPAVLPGETHPARTGAAERNTLGYQWNSGNGVAREMDSVYRVRVVVPHAGESARLDFAGGGGMATGDDETWGIDNLTVEALGAAGAKPLGEVELRKVWEAVGGRDAAAEAAAFWKLVEAGDESVAFLRGRVKPAGVDRARFERLVKELDGDDFAARERATEAIRAMGPAAEGALREAVDRAESAEVRMRLETALRTLAKAPQTDPEARRHAVAMTVLRTIGTAEAAKAADALSGK